MKQTIKLRNVCACRIPAALEALIKEAISHLDQNHPPCPMLELLKLERHHVPLGIDLTGCLADYGLFTELPNPRNRLGTRVFGAAVRMCAACRNQGCPGAAGCGQRCGRCRHCGNDYSSELTLYLTVYREFPFSPKEVACFFYRYFDMPELAAATVTYGYDHLYDIADEVNTLATARLVAPPPQPAQRRKSGAPPLDCNVWLYETMCAMPDPRAYGHLRPEWQERYLQQMGVEPAGWDKSFREAARHYLHRILRERGELDGQQDDQGDEQGEE